MEKEYLIKKWLNNDLSPEEQKAFEELEDSAFFKEIIVEGKRFKGKNENTIPNFDRIEKHLIPKEKQQPNWINIALKIAAIFVLSFSVYSFFSEKELVTFSTQFSQKETIILPDNSVVNLNETSTLKYNKKTWKDKKTLQLKGEAFFNVTKGKRFDVATENGIISVLGTAFNVQTNDSIFKVACYEGIVQVSYKKQLIKLPAGDAFEVLKGKTNTYTIAISQPHWLENMSVFNQAKISDVLNTLSKQYNILIDYKTIDTNILFTGAFEHNNLENSLKGITKTLNLTYKIKNTNEVIIRNVKK